MGKLIFAIFLGVLVYLLLRSRRQGGRAGRSSTPTGVSKVVTECAYCHVHVPQDEGVLIGSKFYCCEEHRRLGGG
ncbi:MAG: PP0621 family protein [Sterolibacteriaceae bacterium MAG5]|nr:PP0621 family protein [Candidatus Nitricoxidireducens bremensis]